MNLRLFRSRSAWFLGLLVGGMVAWQQVVVGAPAGSRAPANATFLLASGWLATTAFLALFLYAVRRAMLRLRLSPEFARAVPLRQLELAQSELTGLQNRAMATTRTDRRALVREAQQILRATGTHRVLRATATKDPSALGQWRLSIAKRQSFGPLADWLGVHVYLGLAAAALVFLHGGLRCDAPIGLLLNGLSIAVIGTGLLGIVLWSLVPAALTRMEGDTSIERTFALRDHFARKVAAAEQKLAGTAPGAAADQLRTDLVILRGQGQRIEAAFRRRNRLRLLLRGWRLVHVPASILLLALVLVHVVGVLHY